MELYLQFGHGMMGHTEALLARWRGQSGVILSPRDLDMGQLKRVSEAAHDSGARVLLDPQCYVPDATHQRLVAHEYWEAMRASRSSFLGGGGANDLLSAVARINAQVGTDARLIPGLLATDVDSYWFQFHSQLVDAALRQCERPIYATIAIGEGPMRDEAKLEAIVEWAEQRDVDGYYVVAESPTLYLVDDPLWLGNLLILTSGLKLHGRHVIVGYSNHQGLMLSAANADVIASGTWLNVRAFRPKKFFEPEEDETSRRAKWYYCPHALSEYKPASLDVALQTGVLTSMRPVAPLSDDHCLPLFSGAQPSSSTWGEQSQFRHYLDSLWVQARTSKQATFDATLQSQIAMLEDARAHLGRLHNNAVRGGDRDYRSLVDDSLSALSLLERANGPMLRRHWA